MASRHERFTTIFETLGAPHRGSFVRGVPLQFQDSPLSAIGSIKTGGRYNAAGVFEVLYLGENADTVIRETRLIVRDATGREIARPQAPKIIMTIDFALQRVVDIGDAALLKRLRVPKRALLAEWTDEVDVGRVPLTHQIGAAALDAGIEALLVPSARHPSATNLAVIPHNLLVGSYVEIYDPTGFDAGVRTRIEGKKRSLLSR